MMGIESTSGGGNGMGCGPVIAFLLVAAMIAAVFFPGETGNLLDQFVNNDLIESLLIFAARLAGFE